MQVGEFQIEGTTYEILQATAVELDQVLSVLVQAAEWLKLRGIRQWGHYLDGATEERHELLQSIQQGEVYLVRQGEVPAGTITLQATPGDWDRQIWGDVSDDDALYVHRFAVARAFGGQGLGKEMLDFAEQHGRALGKRYLRLDCVGHNHRLNEYYKRRYQFQGHASHIGMLFSRYEAAL